MFPISSVVFATLTSAPVGRGMYFHSVIASSFSKLLIVFIASTEITAISQFCQWTRTAVSCDSNTLMWLSLGETEGTKEGMENTKWIYSACLTERHL